MSDRCAAPSLVPRYLSYPGAASYLGMSTSTLRRLVEEKKVATYKPTAGRKVLFDRNELDALIHASREASR